MTDIEFFAISRPLLGRDECDNIARELLGREISPVSWQGQNSYTVQSDQQIVQFRSEQESIDQDVAMLIKDIHNEMVPAMRLCRVEADAATSIWVMDKMPGIMFIELVAREQLTPTMQENTLKGMGRFFADAWAHPQPRDSAWLSKTESKLSQLEKQLPTRFCNHVKNVRKHLPDIMGLPWVVTHTDLSDANILVHPESGELTGVVDWGEAYIAPFGMALWGLESLLGSHSDDGFDYIFEDHARVRSVFEKSFKRHIKENLSRETWRAIEASRALGTLLRYGFSWHPDGFKVINEDDADMVQECQLLETLLSTSLTSMPED